MLGLLLGSRCRYSCTYRTSAPRSKPNINNSTLIMVI